MRTQKGFSLLETLVSIAIFSLMTAAVYSTYMAQVKHTAREYQMARSDMDIQVAKTLMDRDIMTAGFGLASDFGAMPDAEAVTLAAETRAIRVIKGAAATDPDAIILMGTALGIESRIPQGWTVSDGIAAPYRVWDDEPRDNLVTGDLAVAINPDTRKIASPASPWLETYNTGVNAALPAGTSLYGLRGVSSDPLPFGEFAMPHYWVMYSLYTPGEPDTYCAPGTLRLGRKETWQRTAAPNGAWGRNDPFIPCVLNMQVALGLDTNEDQVVDIWDDGGGSAAGLSASILNEQVKQIRVYILVQASDRDANYSHPSPVLVGDNDLGVGTTITLKANLEQEKYRWELLTSVVTPRNIR